MPEARRQRDKFFAKQKAEGMTDEYVRFVHYTSAESALSIIKSKRMWMRNTNCMSDYREVQHGLDILNKFFSEDGKRKSFTEAVDTCAPGVAEEAIKAFNGWWNDIRFSTYVTSISEHDGNEDSHGRLSMWRAFGGNNTARVALVFKVPRYSGAALALNIMFSPVAYLTENEVHDVLQEIIRNIDQNREFLKTVDRQILVGIVFNTFLAAVTCLKHEGFREEREWRVIYCPHFRSSPLIETSVEVVGGVPQPIYKLPLDVTVAPALDELDIAKLFDRLIIGPSPYSWPISEAFRTALTNAGVQDAASRVWPSLIPIRS